MHYKYQDRIFTRKLEEKELQKYLEYKNKLLENDFNIDVFYITQNKLIEYFELKEHKFFVIYCLEKIKKWIYFNEAYTEEYINKLQKILHNFKLTNKLNSYETEYINHVKAVVFNKKRNLKQLVTDFQLINKKEIVCFNFSDSAILKKDENNNYYKKINKCEIYISNSRIIINHPSYIYSIHFKYIFNYRLEDDLFRLDIYNEHENDSMNHLYFDSNDNYVLYVSFERIFNQYTKNLEPYVFEKGVNPESYEKSKVDYEHD